jgi:hypothetical protein
MTTKTPPVPRAGKAQGSKEEPEIGQEDDIPSDDGTTPQGGDEPKPEKLPLRNVERE